MLSHHPPEGRSLRPCPCPTHTAQPKVQRQSDAKCSITASPHLEGSSLRPCPCLTHTAQPKVGKEE